MIDTTSTGSTILSSLQLGMRMCLFSLFFITPLAAFTSIAADTGGKATATGLVLFVSLQK